MPTYRKKPVEIEAFQYMHDPIPDWYLKAVEAEGRAGFNAGWAAAIEEAAKVASSYPEGFGEEYVAFGMIGKGQDYAAKDIAEAIMALATEGARHG